MADRFRKGRYNQAFKDEIAKRESRGSGDYLAYNEAGKAHGRYQVTIGVLQDTGFMNSTGQWTGKYGVYSKEDYLNNSEAQERGIDEMFDLYKKRLKLYKVYKHKGISIQGRKRKILVTESGLVAAAHRRGSQGVRDYFDHVRENGGVSDLDAIKDKTKRDRFMQIETRLGDFQNVPLHNQ